MEALRRSARFTVALGVLAALTLLLSHLALTDIARGEGDLNAEWAALRVAFVLLGAFLVSAFLTAIQALRFTR